MRWNSTGRRADRRVASQLLLILEWNDGVFTELERYERSDIRLASGDHEHTSAGWREACIRCAIELRHNPVLAAGSKNAAGIALVIAAMDPLHGGGGDGFAIVSSDTDFVRLATRIREAGLPVFGFGPWGTSERFRKACTRYFLIENLVPDAPAHPAIVVRKPPQDPRDAGDEIREAIARLYPAWAAGSASMTSNVNWSGLRPTSIHAHTAIAPCSNSSKSSGG